MTLFIPPIARATDANSDSLSGALFYFYVTGTTTPATTYTTNALSVAHANPVVADSGGKFPNIYLDPTITYRAVMKTSGGATVFDVDPSTTDSGDIQYAAAGTGAVPRTVEAKLRDGPISVKDFGATGDGTTPDYAAIEDALAAAKATGRGLLFPDGTYAFGTTLELGTSNLHIIFEGEVTLKHTGTGTAVSFDSGPCPSEDGETNIHFGWGNEPTLIGNAGTTDLIYVRGCHHMKLAARMRDCTTGFRCEFSVLSEFRLNGSLNEGGFPNQTPTNWVVVDKRGESEATTACRFHLILEGSISFGLVLVSSQHCNFWGTSEANDAGGVQMTGNENIKNIFDNFFCEQNGTGRHWEIAGNDNLFFNCSGGGPLNSGLNASLVSGIRNKFIRGYWHDLTVTGYYNDFDQVALSGTPTIAANNILTKCHNGGGTEIDDAYPAPIIVTPTLSGSWLAQNSGGQRAPGYYKDRYGVVHLVGAVKNGTSGTVIFTLPVGCRPGGTVWLNFYSPTAGTTGALAIAANGGVQHISGDTGTVTLDNVYFLAQN
jgi:hypothetical protein